MPSRADTTGEEAVIGWSLLLIVCVLAGLWLHDFLEGETLLADLYDGWNLARTDINALDRHCANNPNRADVVVSVTTIPSRIALIGDTLKSLMRQTRAPREIRLNIPRHSKRENRFYEIPEWLRGLKCVTLIDCEDYGPATKLIPSVLALPPEQKIVVVDDDRIYPKDLIRELDDAATRAPDCAFGLSGWIAPRDLIDRPTTLLSKLFPHPPAPLKGVRLKAPRAVDVLRGCSGYLVRPRFFKADRLVDYSAAPGAAFFVDDVWISAHCEAAKFVIPSARGNFHPHGHLRYFHRTSLAALNQAPANDEERNNTILLKYFAHAWNVGGDRPLQS